MGIKDNFIGNYQILLSAYCDAALLYADYRGSFLWGVRELLSQTIKGELAKQ